MRACMGWPETIRSRRLGYPLPAPGEIPVLSQGKWPDARLTDGATTAPPACSRGAVAFPSWLLGPLLNRHAAHRWQWQLQASLQTSSQGRRVQTPIQNDCHEVMCLLMTYLNCEEFTCPVPWCIEDPIRRTTFMKWWLTTPLPSILHRNKEAWNPWPKILFKIRLV